jgi:hypothetical protein
MQLYFIAFTILRYLRVLFSKKFLRIFTILNYLFIFVCDFEKIFDALHGTSLQKLVFKSIMNRTGYFDYIEEKLNLLATRINARGRLNILDLHLHSENFYAYFFQKLYKWELKNENAAIQNIEAIDLIDTKNKIVVQISSTNTKTKIEQSLEKKLIRQYSSYTFKFVSIANDADNLRKTTFINPHDIKFTPLEDIIDKNSILKSILALDIDDQRQLYELIKKELGTEIDAIKLDSNLANVINILSKEPWKGTGRADNFNPFEIERKIVFNKLKKPRQIIEDYKIFHHKVDEKYKAYDDSGYNKSYSILQLIGKYYVEESSKSEDADIVFSKIGNRLLEKVQESANFVKVEFEILVLCIDILMVDAFIRCKIFENPENYNHVAS